MSGLWRNVFRGAESSLSETQTMRFETTYFDLKDCYEHMEDEIDVREETFRDLIIDLCRDIAFEYGED